MRRAAILLSLMTLALPVSAARVNLSPTTLALPATQRSVSVTVTNAGEDATTFEVQVLNWTQPGEDQLQVTDQLIAAPTRFTLQPGAQQVIRVARLSAAPPSQRAYRLRILQLPGGQGGVQFTLQHLLPLFDGPPGAPRLITQSAAGHLQLRNAGTGTIRLANLEVQQAGTWQPIGLRYVLPGGHLTVPTPGAAPATALRYLGPDGKTVTLPIGP